MSVVALASETYCQAEEIAERVARSLDLTLVDRDFFDAVSRKLHIPADTVRKAMSGERTLLSAFTRDYERIAVYAKAVLARILVQQHFVYHGAAARLIPTDITHVLRVGIVGTESHRVENAMAREGWGEKKALRRLRKSDERRSVWAQQHLRRRFWEPEDFDLIIPRPAKSVDAAVDLICDAITGEALLPNDRSVPAQLDFLLSSDVGVALLERGNIFADVTASRGRVTVRVRSGRAPKGSLGRVVHALRQESRIDQAHEIARGVPGVETVEVVPQAIPPGTLIVDDERDYVVTLSERLQMRDIVADVAFDGEQALDAVKTKEPAVVVLDLRMPGLDGIDVLRRLKRDHPRVHVIIITGKENEEDEELARSLGAFDFLRKPVSITTLAARISEARQLVRTAPEED